MNPAIADAIDGEPESDDQAPERAVPDHTATFPVVSVVVPTRDRPELLRRAVSAIVEQEYEGEIECLVVFDQEQPVPVDVPAGPGRSIRLLTNTHSPGLAGGRNTGICAATGELVAFCDDDDEWMPEKLARQVALLQETGALVASCSITVRFTDSSVVREAASGAVGFEDLLRDRVMALHPSTFLAYRSAVIDQIGLVDEAIPGSYAEDYEFLLRAARVSPIVSVPAPLVDVHWHTASFFFNRWQNIVDGLTYLLAKYPEIKSERRGYARIAGQIAFAYAATAQRPAALTWAWRTVRSHWSEPRAYLAVAVAVKLVSADRILRTLQARGRGI